MRVAWVWRIHQPSLLQCSSLPISGPRFLLQWPCTRAWWLGPSIPTGGEPSREAQLQGTPLLLKIALLVVNNQLIGQPAGLGTLAPVGTVLAESFAGEALAPIGNAKGAMHKHL